MHHFNSVQGTDHASQDLSFLIGQDEEGHWLALEIHGLAGGFFTSRDAAWRYAMAETGRRSGAIHFTPKPIEFHA